MKKYLLIFLVVGSIKGMEHNQLYDPEFFKYDPSMMSLKQLLSLAMDDPQCVTTLLSIDSSIVNEPYKNKNEENAQLPLVRAVEKGNIETIRLLLEAGADPNKEELCHGWCSPLIAALSKKSSGIEIIKLLKKHGVDPRKHTYLGANALGHARDFDMDEALKILKSTD